MTWLFSFATDAIISNSQTIAPQVNGENYLFVAS